MDFVFANSILTQSRCFLLMSVYFSYKNFTLAGNPLITANCYIIIFLIYFKLHGASTMFIDNQQGNIHNTFISTLQIRFTTYSEIFVILLQTVRYASHLQKNDVLAQKLESKLFHPFHSIFPSQKEALHYLSFRNLYVIYGYM